jgi:hypothetical protein
MAAGCRRSLGVEEATCTKAVEVGTGVEPVEREVVAASTAAVAIVEVGEAEGRQPSESIYATSPGQDVSGGPRDVFVHKRIGERGVVVW